MDTRRNHYIVNGTPPTTMDMNRYMSGLTEHQIDTDGCAQIPMNIRGTNGRPWKLLETVETT